MLWDCFSGTNSILKYMQLECNIIKYTVGVNVPIHLSI